MTAVSGCSVVGGVCGYAYHCPFPGVDTDGPPMAALIHMHEGEGDRVPWRHAEDGAGNCETLRGDDVSKRKTRRGDNSLLDT